MRTLVGLAWAIERQIGKAEIGGCNSRPIEALTRVVDSMGE